MGETGSYSDGAGPMLSKSLMQFSVDGWDCVPSLLFDLRPNYGGGNKDNGNEDNLLHDIIFITSTIVWPQVKQQGGNTVLPST